MSFIFVVYWSGWMEEEPKDTFHLIDRCILGTRHLRIKREISSRRRFCSGRSNDSVSIYSYSWFGSSWRLRQIYSTDDPSERGSSEQNGRRTFHTANLTSSVNGRHFAMPRIDPRSQPRANAALNSFIQEFSSVRLGLDSSDMIWKRIESHLGSLLSDS